MKNSDARTRILTKAAALFFQKGYSEVGINEIIEKSGTAKATFYRHFPSKKALCETWLAEAHAKCEESLRELLQSGEEPASKIARYFEQLSDYLKINDFRGCPYSNTAALALGEESIVRKIRQHKESIRDFFRQLAGQIMGPADRADELGDALFLLYSGATTEAQNLRELWPVAVAGRLAAELCRRSSS